MSRPSARRVSSPDRRRAPRSFGPTAARRPARPGRAARGAPSRGAARGCGRGSRRSSASWPTPATSTRGSTRRSPLDRCRLRRRRRGAASSARPGTSTTSPRHRRVEIGWTWLRPSAWGTGANVETKLLLLEHAFERLRPAARRVQDRRAQRAHARGAARDRGRVRGDLPQAHDAADRPARFRLVRDHRGRLARGEGRSCRAARRATNEMRRRGGGDSRRATRRRRAGHPGAPARAAPGQRSAAHGWAARRDRLRVSRVGRAEAARRAETASCRQRRAATPLDGGAPLPGLTV